MLHRSCESIASVMQSLLLASVAKVTDQQILLQMSGLTVEHGSRSLAEANGSAYLCGSDSVRGLKRAPGHQTGPTVCVCVREEEGC